MTTVKTGCIPRDIIVDDRVGRMWVLVVAFRIVSVYTDIQRRYCFALIVIAVVSLTINAGLFQLFVICGPVM